MPSRTALVGVLLVAASAQARSVEGKVAVTLPKGSAFAEAQVTSLVFENAALVGPVGGPTHGFDVAVELWPLGPNLLVEGRYGKDELKSDPVFNALWKPALKLDFARDGHALAVSADGGKTWRGVWIDGPVPIVCTHNAVTPSALVPTKKIVLEILGGQAHDHRTRYENVRSAIAGAADEREAAMAYAEAHSEDADLRSLTGKPAPEPKPVPAVAAPQPASKPCTLGPPAATALPSNPAPADGLALLGFTPAATAASCAQWKKASEQIDAALKAVVEPARPDGGVRSSRALMNTTMCVSMAQQHVVALGPFGLGEGALASAGQPAIDGFVPEASRCGHVGKRDGACEAKVKERRRTEWFKLVNAARMNACASKADFLALVKQCLAEPAAAATLEPWQRAQQLKMEWGMVSMLAQTMGPASCPLSVQPEFPELP